MRRRRALRRRGGLRLAEEEVERRSRKRRERGDQHGLVLREHARLAQVVEAGREQVPGEEEQEGARRVEERPQVQPVRASVEEVAETDRRGALLNLLHPLLGPDFLPDNPYF